MRETTKKMIEKISGLEKYLKEHDYGDMSPVDKNLLPSAPKSAIILDKVIADRLVELAKRTQDNDSEYTFILCGNVHRVGENKNEKTNFVKITGFYEHNFDIHRRVAHFDAETTKIVDTLASGKTQFDSFFVCHTHPAKGYYYDNFSLGDLDGTISLYENNPQFKIDDFGQAILTGDGQMLFAFYDPKSKCIYKFEKTLVNLSKDSCIDISRYITMKNYEQRTPHR